MYYSIICKDNPNSLELRLSKRSEHRQRLVDLQKQGRLTVAGPMPAVDNPDPGAAGFVGSLIVAQFANLDEATAWANADPYLTNGVYTNVEVQPFCKVFPN